MLYNKDFFEGKFDNWTISEGNAWRFWRASQKNRMSIMAQKVHKVNSLALNEKIAVCEIGVATADFTQFYYKKNEMQVLGVDISEKAIEICKKKYAGDKTISFQQSNLFDIEEEHVFDTIICMDTLHYYNNELIEKAIKKLYEIKKKNGYIVLSIPLTEEDSEGSAFLEIVKGQVKVVETGYINNYFYDYVIEPKLLYLYDVLCVDKLLGKVGMLMGETIVKAIIKSLFVFKVSTVCGKILRKRSNSHIYVLAK